MRSQSVDGEVRCEIGHPGLDVPAVRLDVAAAGTDEILAAAQVDRLGAVFGTECGERSARDQPLRRADWTIQSMRKWPGETALCGSNLAAMLPIGPSPTNTFEVLLHTNTPITPDSGAMIATVTIPPGDPGSGPHRHSGPVFGYMIKGEMLFELEGQEPYVIKEGQGFWEPGFDLVHYRASNLRNDIEAKFVVVMLCAPKVPMMVYLDEDEINARADLRHPSVHAR